MEHTAAASQGDHGSDQGPRCTISVWSLAAQSAQLPLEIPRPPLPCHLPEGSGAMTWQQGQERSSRKLGPRALWIGERGNLSCVPCIYDLLALCLLWHPLAFIMAVATPPGHCSLVKGETLPPMAVLLRFGRGIRFVQIQTSPHLGCPICGQLHSSWSNGLTRID